MIEESKLVPFEVSPLPPGPWLVFAPHADDETFGMGGSLLKANLEGLETHVIVMTDGALGGDTNDLVAIRKEEVTQATNLLGVRSLQCWTEPDRSLDLSQRLIEKITQAIIDLLPATVFFPGPLEIHPDHRAAGLLVWSALQAVRAAKIKPEAIAYEISVQNPVNLFIDITGQRATKEEVMAIYASQNSENDYPGLVLALDKARTFSLPAQVKCAEGFYRFQPVDLDRSLQELTHRIIDLYQS